MSGALEALKVSGILFGHMPSVVRLHQQHEAQCAVREHLHAAHEKPGLQVISIMCIYIQISAFIRVTYIAALAEWLRRWT